MRPDRIIMGEVRREKEAETLFEAIHTGHSCYATFHANDSFETVTRLTNPPINIPKLVLPALSAIVVQNRNRRTNKRRTMQFAELLPNGMPNVIRQYDPLDDAMKTVGQMKVIPNTLRTFTGMTEKMIQEDLQKKIRILRWMVDHNIRNLNDIGILMAKYYRGKLVIK
jgi:flagellar protein FlaI